MIRTNMIPCLSYKRLYKLTNMQPSRSSAFSSHIARLIAMKRVADRVVMESKHYAAIQRTIQGYTLCKLQGQRSQLWRGMQASH